MHRQQLLSMLSRHRTRFMEEAAYLTRARKFVSEYHDCFHRELWPAHVTGSTWVINPDRDHVLMLHHRKHNQWFQPGGHADGDSDILRVALRETSEESGLPLENIHLLNDNIFDVDIHSIDARNHDPWHEHIDIRFLVGIDDRLNITGNHESNDILWVPLSAVMRYNNNRSTYRMLEKTRLMGSTQNSEHKPR